MRFTEYVVNNSITNTLSDDKFDIGSPFNFIEYLNYVKLIDTNDLENFNQYKKYLQKWKATDFDNNKDNSINIRAIYLNFFNDLTLKYSTQEQRRFFNTIDLDDESSLSKIIPFYRSKIVEILNYYREKRNTFQQELRENKDKGSDLSVRDQIRNNIVNFFSSPDYTGEVVSLSSLRIDVEVGYDTFNNYFDVNPDTVPSNETYISNDINTNVFLDIDKALIEVLNNNKITISELNPYKLVIEFNQSNTDLLKRDDFIDYKITDNTDTYRVLFEAELSENLVGTDYYYLSNTGTEYVSGKLFEAKNKAKNLFNVNFPSVMAKEKEPSGYERSVGLFFNPTKFSILKVDGEYITKIKKQLIDNYVYVFPDPAEYGDVVNLSNTKRKNPFNFYFDDNTYKNVSSSSSRNTVKSNERNHYFHSYQSLENKRINITNDGNFPNTLNDLMNYGSVDKIETDIYGNEYIQVIPNLGVIRNTADIDIVVDSAFKSGNTIDRTQNRYGDIDPLSGFYDKSFSYKNIFIKDIITKELKPLSSSGFNIIYDKFTSNNTLYNQITGSDISDINVYEDTISLDLSTFSVVDTFKYNNDYLEQTSSPLIIEKDLIHPDFAFITEDCYNNNSIYKFNISLSGNVTSNTFIYELYKYDTSKKTIDQIQDVDTEFLSIGSEHGESIGEDGIGLGIEPVSYPFNFNSPDGSITINKIINSELKYNSFDNSYILTTTYSNTNNSIVIHYFNYKIFNNKISIIKNDLFSNFNTPSIEYTTNQVKAEAERSSNANSSFYNFLTGSGDCVLPSLSFPTEEFFRTVTLTYSGDATDINFDLQNVNQNSSSISLYKAEIDFGDNTNEILYSKFQSDNTLKLDNFTHRYNSFSSSVSSTGSIKFYYENGNKTTVNLRIVKLVSDLEPLQLKAINGQKTNNGKFIFNLIDKNNTLYNFLCT